MCCVQGLFLAQLSLRICQIEILCELEGLNVLLIPLRYSSVSVSVSLSLKAVETLWYNSSVVNDLSINSYSMTCLKCFLEKNPYLG